jgi:translation initiation factor 4A
MQALYAYYQSENKDLNRAEQEMLNGTRKIFELYLMVLQFYVELAHQEEMYYDDLPASAVTGLRKTTNRFIKDLPFVEWLQSNKTYAALIKQYKVNTKFVEYKFDTLVDLYKNLLIGQCIIFVNSIKTANILEKRLTQDEFGVSKIHGELSTEENYSN